MSQPPASDKQGQPAAPRTSAWDNHIVPVIPVILAVICAALVALFFRHSSWFEPHPHGSAPATGHAEAGSPSGGTPPPALSALPVGSKSPMFTLPDSKDRPVALADELKRGPVLLVFYLGYGCPRCVRNLREVEADYDKVTKAGVRVLAISPDPPERSKQRLADFGEFPFPLLADTDRLVARAYHTYDGDTDLHAVYLVDGRGVIRFAYTGAHPLDDLGPALKLAASK